MGRKGRSKGGRRNPSRSHSPRGQWALQRLAAVRSARRRGDNHRRILKGALLEVLRYFLRVVSGLLDLTPANDPSQRYLVTRHCQCREQIHEVENNRFPGRWDPLFPRLLDDNDDLDSVVAETIVVTSDEEADQIAVPDRATGQTAIGLLKTCNSVSGHSRKQCQTFML